VELQQQARRPAAPLDPRQHVRPIALEPAHRLVFSESSLPIGLKEGQRLMNAQVVHLYSEKAGGSTARDPGRALITSTMASNPARAIRGPSG
jgi:hypothetical protein